MARTAVKYVFVALLALLSTQAVTPSSRLAAGVAIVCFYIVDAEQQTPREHSFIRRANPFHSNPAAYQSRVRPSPAAPILFQRPPPVSPLFV